MHSDRLHHVSARRPGNIVRYICRCSYHVSVGVAPSVLRRKEGSHTNAPSCARPLLLLECCSHEHFRCGPELGAHWTVIKQSGILLRERLTEDLDVAVAQVEPRLALRGLQSGVNLSGRSSRDTSTKCGQDSWQDDRAISEKERQKVLWVHVAIEIGRDKPRVD